METTQQIVKEGKSKIVESQRVDIVDVPIDQQPQLAEMQHKEVLEQKEEPQQEVAASHFNILARSVCNIVLLIGFFMSLFFGFYLYPETREAAQGVVDAIQGQHAKPSVLFNAWSSKQAKR